MNDRRCFEALDRTLRDIFDTPTHIFSNKTIMLGGDFRQTLPVKKKGTKEYIITSSISESYLWHYFKILFLHENMHLHQSSNNIHQQHQLQKFSEWLLHVGDGDISTPDVTDPDNTSWIRIPDCYFLPPNDEGLHHLIHFIYDEEALQ